MADYYLDTEAKDDRARNATNETDSEGEASDVIPMQNRRTAKQIDYSQSDSEEEERTSRTVKKRGKENRGSSSSCLGKRRQRSQSPDTNRHILAELKEANILMKKLSKKMKRNDDRLQAIEDKLEETASSSSNSTPRRKAKKIIPREVSRETRRIYNLLVEEAENDFYGWKIEPGITFKDPQNQTTQNILMQEVVALNSSFLSQDVRDAAYRFYLSRKEDLSAKRRGKFDDRSKSKRRHERLVRKLQERKKAFETGSFENHADKEKWSKVLKSEFMSSDESGVDDGNEVLITKPLEWESEAVTSFKQSLDARSLQQKSPLARRQMKARKRGLLSTRPKPPHELPSWAVTL